MSMTNAQTTHRFNLGDHVTFGSPRLTGDPDPRAVGYIVRVGEPAEDLGPRYVVRVGRRTIHGVAERRLTPTTRPTTSALGALRDHSVSCVRCCRSNVWNHEGECDACLTDGAGR